MTHTKCTCEYKIIVVYFLTTSNTIIIGLFTKILGSAGSGSIWSENIGEAGYWGTAILGNDKLLYFVFTSQSLAYPDGSLRTLLFVIIALATVSTVESVPNLNE